MVQLHKNRKAIDQKSALQKAFESLGSFDTVTEDEAPERRNELIQAIDRVKSKVGIQLENFHPGNPVIGNHFVQFKVSVEVATVSILTSGCLSISTAAASMCRAGPP